MTHIELTNSYIDNINPELFLEASKVGRPARGGSRRETLTLFRGEGVGRRYSGQYQQRVRNGSEMLFEDMKERL